MTIAVPRALRRALMAAAAGATVAAGVAVAAIAPTSPPPVTITVGGDTAQIEGADALLQGAVELTFASTGKPATALAFRLPAGGDLDAFGKKVAKLRDPSELMADGSFETFAVVPPKGSYTTTIDARTGRYAIVDLPRRGAPRVVGSFDVGEGTAGAVAPEPDATIRLREYGIGAPRTIPGKGVVRVQNTGKELHELVAARIGKGQTQNEALALLKAGKDRKVKFTGAPGPIVGLVSPGTTNDVQVSLPKGRYVLVCFYADKQSKGRSHISLGMGGAIKVR
jgi:hypothetical protein